jgi:alkylated DNA repair dioxygenase AlkB
MTNDLFSNDELDSCIKIDMQDADVELYPELFSQEDAGILFDKLKDEISWQQEKIKMFGQVHDIPRLTAWYGEPNKTYVYSGIKVHSDPWTKTLLKIKEKIEKVSSVEFNSVLLNLYRDGSDGVSWHSDDEPELGHNPVIGSVSFGERAYGRGICKCWRRHKL